MNYHRKQWEKNKRRNPIAKHLQDREHRPRIIPDKTKINLQNLKDFIDDE